VKVCGLVTTNPIHWFVIRCGDSELTVYRWNSETANAAGHACPISRQVLSGFQKLGMDFLQPGKGNLSEFNRQLYDCFQFLI
jgi:hypothetical protein